MFEHLSASEAVKWAALVFAAGFIGFFGKFLGRAILSIFQKKKTVPPASKPSGDLPLSHIGPLSSSRQETEIIDSTSKDEQKIIKKALKAQEKAMKKQEKS